MFEHISALLSPAERYSMLLIERAVVGLLRLCLIVAEKVIFYEPLSMLQALTELAALDARPAVRGLGCARWTPLPSP